MNTVKIRSLVVLLTACIVTLPAAAALGGAYSTAVLASNPTAYYQMNENPVAIGTTLTDSSPNGNDGDWGYPPSTAVPNTTLPTSGVAGPGSANGWGGLDAGNLAARFGGNFPPPPEPAGPADMLDLLDDGTFDNENATIAFFMKTDISGNDSRMFTTGTGDANEFTVIFGTTDFFLGVGHDYEAIAIETGDFVPKQIRSSVFNFRSGDWVHLVIVRNGDTSADADIYVNGVDLSAFLSPVGDDYGQTDPSPHIGNRHGNINPGFGGYTGDYDEFAYWNRALTASEARALYDAAVVPEPATGFMAALGILMAAGARRRRTPPRLA
ncbi:MAG: PEP-CTERM sorting domain-containing protein [Planctomycetes bacterium]|nr:PEP-CTERM sorting domain-containing protein [Planctomycetota bacterium]